MKRLFTLALVMALGTILVGSPIDEASAKQYAQSFSGKNNAMGVRNGHVYRNKTDEARFVNMPPQHGYCEFFIFNNVIGKGYVVVE